MAKKAIIVVSLVREAETEKNEAIKSGILKESFIPWSKEVEKVTLVDTDEIKQMLKQRNYSAETTDAIMRWYS